MKLLHTALMAGLCLSVIAEPETKPCESGLTRTKVAGSPDFKNPVSCSVDVDGTLYVTETERRKVADLDIRETGFWKTVDLGLTSVESKLELFRNGITSERFKKHPSLKDHNKDGKITSKDLMEFTEKIHRLADEDGDGIYEKHTLFADGFNTEVTGIAAGVLAWRGDVYSTIAPDVWKLRDTNGDGKADEREAIAHGFGLHINYAGHDMHGLTLGPDGKVYWTIGDKAANVTSKEGVNHYLPDQGALFRCNPDGSEFEVFAYGLRNVQEFAFDDFGNIFGVDNDSDQKGEKERLVFIPEGSDTGWRLNYQYRGNNYNPWMAERISFPDGPDRSLIWLPPLSNYLDGPAGFAYNPGTALSKKYEKAFFLTQFPAGKIMALWLEPDGAGFKMTKDELLTSGDKFVGCNFGPDGGLYVVDWQGGYPLNDKGAVWRIDDDASRGSAIRKEVSEHLKNGPAKVSSEELAKRLSHADQRIRLDAQWELARRKDWKSLLRVAASDDASPVAIAHALWGLAQGDQFDQAVMEKLAKSEIDEIRAQAAKWCSVSGKLPASLVTDPSPRVRFLAAMTAFHLGMPDELMEPIKQVIVENNSEDPYLFHATSLALSQADPEKIDFSADPSPALRRASVIALHRANDRYNRIITVETASSGRANADKRYNILGKYLEDTDPSIVADAAIAMHLFAWEDRAMRKLSTLLDSKREDLTKVSILRAIAASRYAGTEETLLRLAHYAAQESAPEEVRIAALDALATADEEVTLDPVDGRRVDLPSAEPLQQTRVALSVVLSGIQGSDKIKKAANQAIGKVGEILSAEQLAKRALDSSVDDDARLLALRTLGGKDKKLQAQTAKSLLKSDNYKLRIGSAEIIGDDFPELALGYLWEKGLESQVVDEMQRAIRLAGRLKGPEAEKMRKRLIDVLENEMPPLVAVLELVELADQMEAPIPQNRAALEEKKLHLLNGGHADRGEAIFNGSLTANCTACHRIGPEGSEVGPQLDKVGEKGKEYILESLLDPQAQITPNYPTPSTMPPMGLLLKPEEIRDLVEYLSTLKD